MGAGEALVVACLGALITRVASGATPASHFHLDGDYVLGGLFPLHTEATTHPYRSKAWVPDCKQYNTKPSGYSYLQAMRYAVEEINHSSFLLPGVSLGYEMVDICYHTNPVHALLYFLSDDRFLVEVRANYTRYRPRISYRATVEFLSDPRTFPAAFRTIPSTEQQITLILKLLQRFRWNWVVVLYSEDEYGQTNLRQLRTQAVATCVAFQESIPVVGSDPSAADGAWNRIRSTVQKMKGSSAKVAIILSSDMVVGPLLLEAVQQNVTGFVWIAAEAWSMDPEIRKITGLSSLGTFFGIAPEEVPIPGLNDFRIRQSADPGEDDESPADPAMCNQECDDCLVEIQEKEPSLRGLGDRIEFNVYSAVYAVAHALHRLLGCNGTGCRLRALYPWQLLKAMSQVSFVLLNNTVNFDEKGDPPNGFEVVQWLWDIPEEPFRRIASCNERGELQVETEIIVWHTGNNTVPRSVCSEQCGPGEMRKHVGPLSCCFKCVKCTAGTFLNQSNIFTCQSCPPDMWSGAGQEECFSKPVLYLQWDAPAAIFLVVFTMVGFLASGGLLRIFARHVNTPVVRSAGGPLCFLMIASLLVGFGSLLFYIGRPTEVKCVCRRTLFGLCFTLCMACMTVRSFQIVCVFKMAARLPRAYNAWVKYNGQWVFVATVFSLKLGVVAINLYLFPPLPVQSLPSGSDLAVLILSCNPNYLSAAILNNALEMVLSFWCFSFAYMGKALPKHYNEAKYISMCMAGYFTCWVTLVVVMAVGEGVAVTVCDAAAGLSNLLSLCVGYFGPKCYIILFRPEQNTSSFFQTAIQSYTMRSA
ncbi:hypothetical protein JRQ81_009986 [Phrynocephalus forsythii]|uniref:Taste receptor type 1 member 2 n=1 Tax=Phrynocephalus forsythii TaxID=171643 RepID=A0A9Q0X9I9_9SAUR|nr:hypothetical protein JRQ81_009986 [Phrynocephalus forsythii]